jgi:hypothetical protein
VDADDRQALILRLLIRSQQRRAAREAWAEAVTEIGQDELPRASGDLRALLLLEAQLVEAERVALRLGQLVDNDLSALLLAALPVEGGPH